MNSVFSALGRFVSRVGCARWSLMVARKADRDPRADVDFAFELDRAAVGEDDVFDDRKPQPAAAGRFVSGFVYTIEAFKDPLLLRCRNPDARIGNSDMDLTVFFINIERERAAFFIVLDRVFHQIVDQLV